MDSKILDVKVADRIATEVRKLPPKGKWWRRWYQYECAKKCLCPMFPEITHEYICKAIAEKYDI